jgi:heat shock protein HslJ
MRPRHWAIASAIIIASTTAIGCGSGSGDGSGQITAGELAGRTFSSTDLEGHEPAAEAPIKLSFEADLLVADAGCNSMRGGYEVADGTLNVGVMAQTQMACDEALMAQEQWLAALLESGPDISLDEDVLTLSSGDNSLTLRAEPT